jgi:hypothetical protein
MRFVWVLGALAVLSLAALPVQASTFTDGEFVTYAQSVWGNDPDGDPAQPATLLENEFDTVFGPSEVLEVGVPGPAGFSLQFDNPADLIAYLPSIGPPAPLNIDLLDPTSSVSGVFGGEVVALTLNVLFSDDGLLAHPSGVRLGDLQLYNLTGGEAIFNDHCQPDGLIKGNEGAAQVVNLGHGDHPLVLSIDDDAKPPTARPIASPPV